VTPQQAKKSKTIEYQAKKRNERKKKRGKTETSKTKREKEKKNERKDKRKKTETSETKKRENTKKILLTQKNIG